jgi:hypothetical protein
MTGKFAKGASNCEHVMAGNNVGAMLDILDIERIGVITDVDDVCPLCCFL